MRFYCQDAGERVSAKCERKLEGNERPLWIQLDWGKDGRKGRFLLKNENAKTVNFDTKGDGVGFLREKKRRPMLVVAEYAGPRQLGEIQS
jgi:hypothetical protein